MTQGLPFSAVQILGGCTIVVALLGAAYAVGRSQSSAERPSTEPAAPQALASERSALAPPVRLATATPPAVAPTAGAEKVVCSNCGTVTEVRSERRQGEPSGLGAVGGAVLGGILGHQVGGGTGKQIATVGGAVAGGYAGHQIEKQQRSHTVWIVQVRQADGQTRRFERSQAPDVRAGDEVTLSDKGFVRR